ncbi:hypothetical protein OOZ15_09135 [Galbibacter sp. EGI 63066]|uniref:hypothetical protein n=1 Tax=Galbibacter sp. EGI 63066 TaxID=2993559 RepID=UPI002248CBBC|nr:hypothetical protein [Galbibacter sp. EGI 63066]MCX2680100.1 hypothetical protein [Galbibacter sp. EGI 63066]
MTEKKYFEKAKFIWQNYVPESGQSKYVQGELLRAIEKLRDEAHRNGNINFNEKCHGILIDYLRKKLSDKKVFNQKTIEQINTDLDKLSIEDKPYSEDDIFDRISNRVVDWCMLYHEPISHEENDELYC